MKFVLSSFLKSVVLIFPLEKLFLIKNVLNLSYQALGACFRPYNAFVSLKHDLVYLSFQNLGVVEHKLLHLRIHLKMHF